MSYRIAERWAHKHEVDPIALEDYVDFGGFQAVRKVTEMEDQQVLDTLLNANLLGRGGAAYPAGRKWQQMYHIKEGPKYIVCNADEGEPGTFKDRELLMHKPYSVIEGMLIAGWLFKSNRGFIYVRGEYRPIQTTFQLALDRARAAGYLGKNILGIAGFDFDITVVSGAGAYVCGENSTLLNSIEGKAGRPRIKPPHLAEVGLYSKPTLVNNVETYAQIWLLFHEGLEALLANGTPTDGGTKLVSISGHAKNRGCYEIKGGTPIRNILFDEDLGGGTSTGRPIQFYHMGGQSGPIGFPEQMDTHYDYDSLKAEGLSVGSGAMVVMDDSVCLVDYCKHVMEFLADESCGKCTPCRLGTTRLLELLTAFTEGKAQPGDVEKLEEMAKQVSKLAACGLGQAADKALLSALKHRRGAFEAHIQGKCPAGACKLCGGETK